MDAAAASEQRSGEARATAGNQVRVAKRATPAEEEREGQRETMPKVREPPNERRSLGAEAAREQGVLSGPDSLPERARIAKGQESLRRISLLWSRWQVNAEGVCRRALSERACVSPCVPPGSGGRVRVCVAVFASPNGARRHVPQNGDCPSHWHTFFRVEIAREEGCRALREKSTRLLRS